MMYRRFGAKKKTEAFHPKNIAPALKDGSNLMMIWDCFISKGTGRLIAIKEIMKSEDYIKILGIDS